MKRFILQLFRLGVTLVIMGTMAAMIFSLRDDKANLSRELNETRRELKEARRLLNQRAECPAAVTDSVHH